MVRLFLIHGWLSNHQAMQPVADALADYCCQVVDLNGHVDGEIYDPEKPDDVYDVVGHARSLVDLLQSDTVIIGHSMGAQIAIELALLAPEKVRGLILLDPAPIIYTEATRKLFEGMQRDLNRIEQKDFARYVRSLPALQPLHGGHDGQFDALYQVAERTAIGLAREEIAAMCAWDGAPRLAALRVPTLVVLIEAAVNRAQDLRRANSFLTTAQVAMSGHMLQFEVLDQVETMIRRYLNIHFQQKQF